MSRHGINLSKDETCAVEQGIRRIMVGCGWDPQEHRSSQKFDLDVSCVLLGDDGRMPSQQHYVYYRNLKFEGDVVVHTGDNLTGDGDGDDERLLLDLARMPDDVLQIDVYCNIYQGAQRGQTFGMISNCYMRVVDVTHESDTNRGGPLYQATSYANREFCRFQINDEALHSTCVMFGSLYRDGPRQGRGSSSWRFRAVQKEVYGGMDAVLDSVTPRPGSQTSRSLTTRVADNTNALQQRLANVAPFQMMVDGRAVFAILGVGALLFNTVGVVPLVCLAAFLWLSSHANNNK